MGAHRRPQRPGRAGSHRTRVGPGLRTPPEGDRGIQPNQSGSIRGQLSRAVPERHHHAGDGLPGQCELCRDCGGRRIPGGDRLDHVGRRTSLHPVLAPVHYADHAARRPVELAAVWPGVRRARLRVSRLRRGGAGSGPGPAARAARRGRPGARLVSLRAGEAAHHRLQPRGATGPDDCDRRADRRRQDDDRELADALL